MSESDNVSHYHHTTGITTYHKLSHPRHILPPSHHHSRPRGKKRAAFLRPLLYLARIELSRTCPPLPPFYRNSVEPTTTNWFGLAKQGSRRTTTGKLLLLSMLVKKQKLGHQIPGMYISLCPEVYCERVRGKWPMTMARVVMPPSPFPQACLLDDTVQPPTRWTAVTKYANAMMVSTTRSIALQVLKGITQHAQYIVLLLSKKQNNKMNAIRLLFD